MIILGKSRKMFLFPAIFVCCLCFVAPVFAVNSVLVIDSAGQKDELAEVSFEYSDAHKNDKREHFEVLLHSSPRKSFWVHYLQIKTATFKKAKNGLGISIVLDNGEALNGMFADEKMKITGKGSLGEATYDVNKITSIVFLQLDIFNLEDKEWKHLDRKAASLLWKNQITTLPRWKIVDGNTTINAEGFAIRDCFNTNSDGFMQYSGRSFRRDNDLKDFESITAQRGSSQIQVPVDDLKSIEITGRKIGGKVEAVLEKQDGSKFTVALLMLSSADDSEHYGNIDEDDMLTWNTPYGTEGISLLPLRKIVLINNKVKKK